MALHSTNVFDKMQKLSPEKVALQKHHPEVPTITFFP